MGSFSPHTQQALQQLCEHAGKALETGRGKGDEQTVLKLLQFIGAVSGDKSVTQVALGYLIAKGVACTPALGSALAFVSVSECFAVVCC